MLVFHCSFFLCFLPFGCLLFVLPSFLSLCGFSFLLEFVVFCLLSFVVCLWHLLWSLLLVSPSLVVVLLSVGFHQCGICVCVCDGVFRWVADFNPCVIPKPSPLQILSKCFIIFTNLDQYLFYRYRYFLRLNNTHFNYTIQFNLIRFGQKRPGS